MECPPDAPGCHIKDEPEEEPDYPNTYLFVDGEPVSDDPTPNTPGTSISFYVWTLTIMVVFTIISIIMAVVLFVRMGKKKDIPPARSSFTNPNYCSARNNGDTAPNNAQKRQSIWKRLKYDRAQASVVLLSVTNYLILRCITGICWF